MRLLALIALATLFACALSACGGKDSNSEQQGGNAGAKGNKQEQKSNPKSLLLVIEAPRKVQVNPVLPDQPGQAMTVGTTREFFYQSKSDQKLKLRPRKLKLDASEGCSPSNVKFAFEWAEMDSQQNAVSINVIDVKPRDKSLIAPWSVSNGKIYRLRVSLTEAASCKILGFAFSIREVTEHAP